MPATALSRAAARVVESDSDGVHLDGQAWARLEALPDPRSPQGRIYSLASLVAVALCGLTVKANQPLLHAELKALPWKKVPAGVTTRGSGHGRTETRALKAVHVDRLGIDFPHARQAVKITRWRQDTRTGRIQRETVYVITSLTAAEATPADLARLLREHWSVEVEHHIRDISFGEDHSTSRTGHGPTNLATLRSAVKATIKDVGYLYVPEGRRDHTTVAETLYLHGLAR
jgi:predicted transposase YbfD/YdcC